MEIIKIVFILTSLAVTTAVGRIWSEPTVLQPSTNEESLRLAPTVASENLELLRDQKEGDNDDHTIIIKPRIAAHPAPTDASEYHELLRDQKEGDNDDHTIIIKPRVAAHPAPNDASEYHELLRDQKEGDNDDHTIILKPRVASSSATTDASEYLELLRDQKEGDNDDHTIIIKPRIAAHPAPTDASEYHELLRDQKEGDNDDHTIILKPRVASSSATTDASEYHELLRDQKEGDNDDHTIILKPRFAVVAADANDSPTGRFATFEGKKHLNLQGEPQHFVQPLQNAKYLQENLGDDEDCICYGRGGGVPVSERINPESSDLQRVVVYLYYKKGDQKVHLYIPNVQKQHHIPDLPLDNYDLLQPLNSDLLKLFIDGPFSVAKKVFKTRPDYSVERVVQPDVEVFRRLLNKLLLSRPTSYETLIRIIQKNVPKPSRKEWLTFLNSHYPDFEQLLASPREQVFPSYQQHMKLPSHGDYDLKVEPSFEEHTVQPSLEFLLHEEPAYEEHQIVEPSYEVQPSVELSSFGNSFLPGPEEHFHFLPSSEEFEKAPEFNGHKVFPPYNKPSEPYSDYLPVPLTKPVPPSGPEHLSPYISQPEPQVPFEYSERESTVGYPSIYLTETRHDESETPVHPTDASSTENQEVKSKFPTDILPSEDQRPVFPTIPSNIKEPSERPTFDKYQPNSHEETPADARPYPNRPDHFLPDLKEKDEYAESSPLEVYPTRPLQHEDKFPVELYPTRPTRLPTDKLPPTSPSDARPYDSTTPAQLQTPDTTQTPYQNEEGYPVDGRIFDLENRNVPYTSDIGYPWYEPQGDKSFTFPSYDDSRYPSLESQVPDPSDVKYPLYVQSNSWKQGRPQYEVKTKYTQPDLVLSQLSSKALDQPQRLDLIIKYLKQLKSQSNYYVINHKIVQQPGQIDLTLLQRLLNPEYSYKVHGSQQPKAPENFRDPTFEKWFEGQVVDLGNKFGEVNIDSLKILIEGILHDHNLMFTKEGVLINKQGNTLNVGELKLRPIMIGDSVNVGIKTLLEEALNKKIKITRDSPYLHGLLVSLGTPPHVLGLVPLGYKSPPGKLKVSDKTINRPVTKVQQSLGHTGSQIPGQSNAFFWTRFRPQVIRKTFKNIPLDNDGYRKFLANLKLSGLRNEKVADDRLGESKTVPLKTNFEDVKSWLNLNLPQFDSGTILDQKQHSKYDLPEFNANAVHLTGAPQGLGSLSFNADLPSLTANRNIGINVGAGVDPRFRGIDLGHLGGYLSKIQNLTPVGADDADQLTNAADSVLRQSVYLGVPGLQLNTDFGAGLEGSLDSLQSSQAHGSVDLGSEVEVPTGAAKDFKFTEYPVELTHAAAHAPEFRIIGGNAATGSGPPLSNKGKSGPVVL